MKTSPTARTALVGSALGLLLCGQAAIADTFLQTYELPGVQNTTATFSGGVGVETFETVNTGFGGFVSTFGGGPYTGTYSYDARIDEANQYGSAGGTGRHAVTFADAGYSITLDKKVSYFGYWLSALDRGNVVEFYNDNLLVGSLTPDNVLASIGSNANYFGNPNAPFAGKNSDEPYAFVNFYDTDGTFNKIVFRERPQVGGYESDNHTVGIYKDIGGIPAVPEPSTYGLMLLGLAGVVAIARRRRGS
jgi:hypothetical protein